MATRSPRHGDTQLRALPQTLLIDVYRELLDATAGGRPPAAAADGSAVVKSTDRFPPARLRIAAPRAVRAAGKAPKHAALPGSAKRPADCFDWAVASAFMVRLHGGGDDDGKSRDAALQGITVGAAPTPWRETPVRSHSARLTHVPHARCTRGMLPSKSVALLAGDTADAAALSKLDPVHTAATAVITAALPDAAAVLHTAQHATSLDVSRCIAMTSLPNDVAKAARRLKSVELPSSLTALGDSAFHGSGLRELDLSLCAGLRTIGSACAAECPDLREVKLPPRVTTIDEYFAMDCPQLKALDLAHCKALTAIDAAFATGCVQLAAVRLPPSLVTLGAGFACRCAKLTTIDLSGCTSLRTIGADCARATTALEVLTLPASIISIGHSFAAGSAVREIDLTRCTRLRTVGESFACNTRRLSQLALPSSVTSIGGKFATRSAVQHVNLSECASLTDIGPSFALGATRLRTVLLPIDDASPPVTSRDMLESALPAFGVRVYRPTRRAIPDGDAAPPPLEPGAA